MGAPCTLPGSVSHALGGPHGGCRATSQDAAPSEALTHCVRAVFPLGKDQTLALYKNLQDESQENELAFRGGVWQSRLEARLCAGGRMLRPHPRQWGRVRGHAAWRIPRSRVPGGDLIMHLGLPLNLQRVLPTLETNLAHGGDGKIHSPGNRWLGKKQSGRRVRVWESTWRLGEERTGISMWQQMTRVSSVGGSSWRRQGKWK